MKTKVTKDTIPEGFTLKLAIVDAIPVLLFAVDMIVISHLFSSKLFLLGSLLMFYAGTCKVIWKIIVATKKKNVWFLFIQMRYVMPVGFILMIVGTLLNLNSFSILFNSIIQMPVIIFFVLGIIGMVLMLIFMFFLDGEKSKNNWIEQITNLAAQLSFFIGLLLILIK